MKIRKGIPEWLTGAIVSLFFLFITITGIMDFTNSIEMKTFDLRAEIKASDARDPDIELVVITDDDIAEFGRFPWPRNIIATAINNLSSAGARVIALNILFTEPEESAGLKMIKKLMKDYEYLKLAQEGPGLQFYKKLATAQEELDNDGKLINAVRNAGNVILPIYFDTLSTGRDIKYPDFINRFSLKKVYNKDELNLASLIWVSKLKPILAPLADVCAGIGHINLFPDTDGYIRRQVHVIGYQKDIFYPSFALEIVRVYKGLKPKDIKVNLDRGIEIRFSPSESVNIPFEDSIKGTLINWSAPYGKAFHMVPFSKVYKNEIRTGLFKDKIIIIGPVAPGIGDRFVTPVSGSLSGVELMANSVSNILHNRFYLRPAWTGWLEFGVMLLFGVYITLFLPRMRAGTGALCTLGLFVGYLGAGTVLFFSYNIWLKIMPEIILLLIGYVLIVSKHFLITEKTKEKVEADSIETNKMLGLSFQQQGLLDLALEKFRKLPIEEEGTKELLYNLGLDFERKRQFSKALATYQLIVQDGKNFMDLDERIPRLKGAEATMIFGTSSHPGDIGATLVDMDTRPTLGRYEVMEELGRGAMGVVYKGVDPKIHRTVAIKTVRLTDFDPDVAEEMKSRFFREAESAGLLNHPNIVTIYDVGEEHDLAYIAMEFLKGKPLEEYVSKDKLLPLRDVLLIVSKVADALDYAHSKGVIHRDIKPANIMLLDEGMEVKVTDFGIARISSSSKTKTGMVLGTPSYMSPEQIAGKKVDGRSDIFSLGVVLFELLTGEKPFKAEDITSLMYHISKEPHPSPRSINPKVPRIIEKIIDKALEKDRERRYQRASQMAGHLKKLIQKIDEIRAKKA